MTSLMMKLVLCVTFVLLSNVHESYGLRILGVFPLHAKSHFLFFERLMRGLAERGHQVDVYSQYPLKEPIPNYTDYSLAGSMPHLFNNMSYERVRRARFSGVPQISNVGTPICELMNLPIFKNLIQNPPKDPPYDIVIVEMFFANCYLALGRHLNIPIVGVLTTPLLDWLNQPLGNPSNLAVEPAVFSRVLYPMTFLERVNNFLFATKTKFLFNYQIREQDTIVEKFFGPNYPSVVEMQKDLSLVLINHHHALNGNRAFVPAVVPVGGLHIVDSQDKLPADLKKFLDDSKDGFIYFSFGSMARIETFPKPMVEAFYKVFEKIKPIRVLMKVAKPEELPEGLPSNVFTQTWLPQVKILKHHNIKAFITHGGLLGTQEAIYHSVPMVGVPLFSDQHLNIELCAAKKLAIKVNLEDISEQTLYDAITEILTNPVYKETADEVGHRFRDVQLNPMDTAAYWIEYVARHGKDALRSPIVDLPWWEAQMLDVYSFLLLIAVTAIYVNKLIIQKFVTWFLTKIYQFSKLKSKQS